MSFPLRIVGDYDVDRPEVQAWQHVQLTGTNHPTGLIPVFEFVLFCQDREWPERAQVGKKEISVWMPESGRQVEAEMLKI